MAPLATFESNITIENQTPLHLSIFLPFLAIFPARNKKKPPKQVTNNKLVQNWLCGVTMEHIWWNNIAWKVDKLGFQMTLFYPSLSELSFAGAIFLDFLNHFFGSLWGYTKPLWWNFGCVREKHPSIDCLSVWTWEQCKNLKTSGFLAKK